MAMAMAKVTAKARLAVVVHLFVGPGGPPGSTKGTRGTRELAKSFILFGGSFAFLFLGKPLLIFLEPVFEIAGSFFEFVTVQ